MFESARIAFLGSGVMAEAFLQGMVRSELTKPSQIWCSDPFETRLQELKHRYGVHVTRDNAEAVRDATMIILSVKPQVLNEVLQELHGEVKPHQLVISIVAGAPARAIAMGLGHEAIVRAMPNTPARIGHGMTVWTVTDSVTDDDRARTQALFSALGEDVFVDHEEYIDMATALSGTGPAYVFLFMEALIDAGVHMGFSRRVAQKLVLQTMQGSVEFARQSTQHPAELRNMVTSPGGTSAEAIYQLEKGGLRTVVSRAVYAAWQKSRRLSEASFDTNGHVPAKAEAKT
ncbi:MAG TPA: pyrroline-5-carboxylate reductase [Candidatus Xenobia bacterium]|jgi:pyrroline-5-carboxylate reductase